MTGIYYRVKTESGYKPVEIEHLTDSQRNKHLSSYSSKELLSLIDLLCETIRKAEIIL